MKLKKVKKILCISALPISTILAISCTQKTIVNKPEQPKEPNKDDEKKQPPLEIQPTPGSGETTQPNPNNQNPPKDNVGTQEGDKNEELVESKTPSQPIEEEDSLNDVLIEFDKIVFNQYEREEEKKSKSEGYFHELNIEKSTIKAQKGYGFKILSKISYTNPETGLGSERTGVGILLVKITNLETQESEEKEIKISGFKTTFSPEYLNASKKEKFTMDDKEYLNSLKFFLAFGRPFDINKFRPSTKRNLQGIEAFNAKAPSVNQMDYESALVKGFTVPTYDENGQFAGLNINTEAIVGQALSPIDSENSLRNPYKSVGIPRFLTNEMYKDIASQTYSITFNNENKPKEFSTESGTMWILDYQKTNNETYPTKWYFGTNIHVVDALFDRTKIINIRKTKENVELFKQFGLAYSTGQDEENFDYYNFNVQNQNIKTFYRADDFLKVKPYEYLNKEQKEQFKSNKEFVDFAVIEMDFNNIIIKGKTGPELAKIFTNDYANKKDKQIKFLSESYLKNYKKIDKPLIENSKEYKEFIKTGDSLFLLGYPQSNRDFYLDTKGNKDLFEIKKWTFSLWTNAKYEYRKVDASQEEFEKLKPDIDKGNYLSQSLGYRTFTNMPGISDAFIGAPKIANNFYINKNDPSYKEILIEVKDNNGNTIYNAEGRPKMEKAIQYEPSKQLIAVGLTYLPKEYVPFGGSSGSSMRNQNNELVGIFHGANTYANVGLVSAFRSEGYDYQGLYGSYNLPQYDLIYGGGKDQKEGKSFREKLKQVYGDNVTTALFDNINNIPDKFVFKDN